MSRKRPRYLVKPWSVLDAYRVDVQTPATLPEQFSGTWPSLPKLFSISCQRFPDRNCFTSFDPVLYRLSYQEALHAILFIAQNLINAGIKRQERVALAGKNSPQWAMSYLAILFAGAVVVPLDNGLFDNELANIIQASHAKLLIADTDRLSTLAPRVSALLAFSLENQGNQFSYILKDFDPHATVTSAISPVTCPGMALREQDHAAVLYTSGTTGTPKGVVLSHGNLVADCFLSQYHMPLSEQDVFYALLPIHHSYTMLAVFIESISVGAELVFGKRMVTSQILNDLKLGNVSMFLGVPLLFNKVLAGIMKAIRAKGAIAYGVVRALMTISGIIKLLTGKNPGKKLFGSILAKAGLASVRICISGGAPLAPETFKQYNQLGIDFVQGYGLTETSPILTLNPVWDYRVRSVGALVPQLDMKILDPDTDGRGEIAVKGPMVMQGYYENPEENARIFTADGYLKTGDIGKLDADGYLYLTGRSRNLIVTEGGKNVFPEEIENAFQLFPEVAQVLVRGFVADPKNKAEQIEVCLYPDPEAFATITNAGEREAAVEKRMHAIVDTVNHGLHAYQKIIRVTVLQEALAMTTTRKIKRHEAPSKVDVTEK